MVSNELKTVQMNHIIYSSDSLSLSSSSSLSESLPSDSSSSVDSSFLAFGGRPRPLDADADAAVAVGFLLLPLTAPFFLNVPFGRPRPRFSIDEFSTDDPEPEFSFFDGTGGVDALGRFFGVV